MPENQYLLHVMHRLNLQFTCLLDLQHFPDTCCCAGVVGILGSTYTGEFEDIKGMDAVVEELNARHGWELGIHVDAASGGFIAPFIHPNLEWDFRLKNIVSINVSGHK